MSKAASEISAKDYRCSFTVSAEPEEAAKLRILLRDTLEGAGFTMLTGTVTVEVWYAREVEKLNRRNGHSEMHRAASDWMPQGKARKGMGRGPQT